MGRGWIWSILNRNFIGLDAQGRLGGLAKGWKSQSCNLLNPWWIESRLGLELFPIEIGCNFIALDIYGPCSNRKVFWDTLFAKEVLKMDFVIVGGDLNFSIGDAEE